MSTKNYEYARLDAFPELIDQTNSLIEAAFSYQKPFKFSVDFAPLAGVQHANQRHILIDPTTSTVVAHIGARLKNFVWEGETIPVMMIGGIAVAESERGQGLFQLLFERVLATLHTQCTFYLLWSDKHDMYAKWHFHLAGKQWCYRSTLPSTNLKTTRLTDVDEVTRERLASLYRRTINQNYFSPLRDQADWRDLSDVTTAELILMPRGYAFRGKGMDLQGIIHDSAHEEGATGLTRDLGNAGVVWAAQNEMVPDEVMQDLQQVGLWRPNTHPMALRKLSHLLGHEINFRDELFTVERAGTTLKMNAEDLLEEIFNYGKHGLRKDGVPVYVGGLDSI